MGCHPSHWRTHIFQDGWNHQPGNVLQSSHAYRRSCHSVETLMLDVDICTMQNNWALERATSRPQNLAKTPKVSGWSFLFPKKTAIVIVIVLLVTIWRHRTIPIGSMYAIYANIWGILMVNVTIYGIHGSYGIWCPFSPVPRVPFVCAWQVVTETGGRILEKLKWLNCEIPFP